MAEPTAESMAKARQIVENFSPDDRDAMIETIAIALINWRAIGKAEMRQELEARFRGRLLSLTEALKGIKPGNPPRS